MPDTDVNFAPPPETLTTDERLAELARILTTGVHRANPLELSENSANDRDSSLDILALVRRRRHQLRTRVGVDE